MAKTPKATRKTAKAADPEQVFLAQLKEEVAGELGISTDAGWNQLSAKQCGQVGGQMVRKLVKLAAQANAAPKAER